MSSYNRLKKALF